MASVYILYSQKLDRFYIGSCLNFALRLDQHLNKDFIDSFTAKTDDWLLFFSKDGLEYRQARLVESVFNVFSLKPTVIKGFEREVLNR